MLLTTKDYQDPSRREYLSLCDFVFLYSQVFLGYIVMELPLVLATKTLWINQGEWVKVNLRRLHSHYRQTSCYEALQDMYVPIFGVCLSFIST